ncbi:flagellar protein FlaG [Thermosipho sp. 1063]|uniref:flagellar protein FlaG n=1 Tax=unclassified Thermosipho (in: thermotogales) TaxID=2676525 RepID=UPI0009494B8F|nr:MULTISPECIES: flagellar protein FlaG [unclassified Thermosipho (in: thermotogales)]ANQ54352.1 flagellar protein FlaG [Thermosipho sp. 1070]APT72797.1 flagellar protein FlaG [Thermosipho sp. 1063]
MDGVKGVSNGKIEIFENNLKNPNLDQKKEMDQQNRNVDLNAVAKEFKENLEKLKKIFRGEAEFNIDKDTGMIVVKIKDKDTGEIIRQIPPEVALRLAKNLEELIGVIFDERA